MNDNRLLRFRSAPFQTFVVTILIYFTRHGNIVINIVTMLLMCLRNAVVTSSSR